MTRSLYRRDSVFMRFVSTLIALAFTLSIAGPGFAAPAASSDPTPAPTTAAPAEPTGALPDPVPSDPAVTPDPSVVAQPTTADPGSRAWGNGQQAKKATRTNSTDNSTPAAAPAVTGGITAAAPTGGSVQLTLEGYRTSPSTNWTTGNLGSQYREGDWVPYRLIVDNSNGSSAYTMPAFAFVYDHYASTKNAIGVDKTRSWKAYYTSTQPAAGDSNAPSGSAISPSSQDAPYPSGSYGSSDLLRTSFPAGTLVVPAGQYAVVYYQAHLSLTAYWLQQSPSRFGSGYYPGSSMQMRLNSDAGDKTVPIPIPPKPGGGIAGVKFYDTNKNGVKDAGEATLSGWVFHLSGGPEGFALDLTATSGSDGTFAFPTLPAASYSLSEELKSGWQNSTPLPMTISVSEDATASIVVGNYHPDVTKTWSMSIDTLPAGAVPFVTYSVNGASQTTTLTGSGPYTGSVTVPYNSTISAISWYVSYGGQNILLGTSGDETLTADKTNSFTYDSSVAGMKFADDNGDGLKGASEAGLPGWTIVIKRVVDSVETTYAQTVTGAGGAYSFEDVLPGSYKVYEVNQAGYLNTVAPVGAFSVANGTHVTGKDFGNLLVNSSITIEKSGVAQAHVGDTISYTIVVTNNGNYTLTNVMVTDAKLGLNTNVGSLAPGQSVTLNPTYTVQANDPDPLPNTASALGTTVFGGSVTAEDGHSVDILKPAIEIVKTASPTIGVGPLGVTYTYEVTNSGEDTLTGVYFTDDKIASIPGASIGTLAPGQTVTVTATATLDVSTRNIAKAYGTDALGKTVSAQDGASVSVYHPSIQIVKSADPTVTLPGGLVTYTYMVTNTGDIALHDVAVTDDKLPGVIGFIPVLGIGQTVPVSVTTALTETTHNVGTAVGYYGEAETQFFGSVSDSSDADVLVVNPSVQILKSAAPSPVVNGTTVTYTFVVINTGDVPLYDLKVEDPTLGFSDTIAMLGVSQQTTLTTSVKLTETTVNVAGVTGHDQYDHPVSDTDDERVPVYNPSISLVKTAGSNNILAGETVTYTFEVKNTGDIALSDVVVDDPTLGMTHNVGALAVGQTVSFTHDSAISVDTTNVATATGDYGTAETPFFGSVSDTDDAFVNVIAPSVQIVKTPSASPVIAGTAVTYTFVVTNTGDTPLVDLVVDDPTIGYVGTIASLGVGQSVTLESQPVVLNETTSNTVTVEGFDTYEHPVSDDDTVRVPVYNPSISIVKTAGSDNILSGENVTFTYAVTNTGDIDLFNVSVTDDPFGFVGNVGDLAIGQTKTLTLTEPIFADHVNTGTATGYYGTPDTQFFGSVQASDDAAVNVVSPAITIDKSASAPAVLKGGAVTYTYVVTNTGDVTLYDVAVTDDKLGTIGTIAELAPQGSATLTSSTNLDITTTNTGTATGADEFGHEVSASDKAYVQVFSPAIGIVKTADPTVILSGETVTYTYVVTNLGDIELTDVVVTDDKIAGTIGTIASLAPGASQTLTASAPVSVDTVNIAKAVGTYGLAETQFGGTVEATDDASVNVVAPAINVEKSASPTELVGSGDVTYTYIVTNTGDVDLFNVTLTDDKLGVVGTLESLPVEGSSTFTSTATISESTTNTVVAVGTDAVGHEVSDSAQAFVDVALPFTPPDVTIDKSADKTQANPGDTVTYTLTYRNLGPGVAQDMTIVDDFDERYVTVTDAAGGTVAGGKITWTVPGPLSAADGPQTITYKVRIDSDLPASVTQIRNVVVITEPTDSDTTNNSDSWTVDVNQPFLPFTGGEWTLLALAALLASAGGLLLRRASRVAS